MESNLTYGIISKQAEKLPQGKAEDIQDPAKQIYPALGLIGYADIAMRMTADRQLYVLEANPNPQIAEDEDFADSAKETGYAYTELLQELLTVGLRRQPAKAA